MITSFILLLVVIVLAMIIDETIGDPDTVYRRVPHPVVLMGRMIGLLDGWWNRATSSPPTKIIAGAAAVFIVVGISGTIGIAIHKILSSFAFGWVAEAVIMSIFIARHSLAQHVTNVREALSTPDLQVAQEAVAKIVGRDTAEMTEEDISASAIESLSENFSDGVVAPVFWAVLLGLPGIIAYKALNTADSMIGYRSEKYLHFGSVAAKADDIANFIPARISGFLICFAALFVKHGKAKEGWRVLRADASRHRSVNAGFPEAAMAGVLNIRISGPRSYEGVLTDEPWIGDGSRPTQGDLQRGLDMFGMAASILCASIVALAGILYFIS
ncbi:MAG: cobalamin biosynthesis protein CobD [Rhodospirillaceae bacterium]|nr:cobalamin biosynthesis protein CobD [Rhodospirillaceae bacterium]|tara:strand:+ start:7282 stop:8265 length:984 start_codon:yes stop_codon:yes gene_type:complete